MIQAQHRVSLENKKVVQRHITYRSLNVVASKNR